MFDGPQHPHIAVVGEPYGQHHVHIIIEQQLVVRDVMSFPEAMKLLFCFFYTLDIAYPKNKRRDCYVHEYLQKKLFGLESKKLSPKLTTFVNNLG